MNNDLLSLNPLDNPPPEQASAAPAGSADLMDQALQAEAALSAGDTSAVDTLRQIAESGSDTKAAIQSCQSLFFYYMEQAKDTDRAKYYLDRVRNLGGTYWADLASCCYIHDKTWHDLSDSEGRVAAEVVNGEFGQRMDKATEYLLAVADSPETWLLDTTYDTIFRRGVGDNLCLQDYRRNWGVLFRLAKRISRTPELDMLIREEAAAQAVMILRKAKENKSGSKKDYDLAMKETLTKDEKALLTDIGKFVGAASSQKSAKLFLRWGWILMGLAAFLITGFLYVTPSLSSGPIGSIQYTLQHTDESAIFLVMLGVCPVLTFIIELFYLPSMLRKMSFMSYLGHLFGALFVFGCIWFGSFFVFGLIADFLIETLDISTIWIVSLGSSVAVSYLYFMLLRLYHIDYDIILHH